MLKLRSMISAFTTLRRPRRTALLLLAALAFAGCQTIASGGSTDTRTGPWWQCPPTKNATGLEHGKPCDTAADCAYGHCLAGSFLVGYDPTVRFCTKNNACSTTGSDLTAPCSVDDNQGVTFTAAFEKTRSGGNTARTSAEPVKLCGKSCKNDGDCSAWNAQMPHCIKNSTMYVSAGAVGVCGKDPTR